MSNNNICIIGDILIDYTVSFNDQDKMRFGGIFHAARGAWASNMDYTLCYFSPNYIDEKIEFFIKEHNGKGIKVGEVNGAPNVILIKDLKEIGDQGYELLLRDERNYRYEIEKLQDELISANHSDILIFTGGYDLRVILKEVSTTISRVHIDISNDIDDFDTLLLLNKKFDTVFISTSSNVFKKTYNNKIEDLVEKCKPFCKNLVFKQNRGGTTCFNFEKPEVLKISSQTKPIVHSVGVGDNFDLAYINKVHSNSQIDSLNYASWFAMEYASTTYPDDFKLAIERIEQIPIIDLKNNPGVYLPWDDRQEINIYIAAPDFDYVDTSFIDKLATALEYHNFRARRPVRENGQLNSNSSNKDKLNIFKKDMLLLDHCNILIAVLLFDDPGTLIEIGLAAGAKIPVIVYDPFKIAANCVLTSLPRLVTNDLDMVISEVFIISKNK
ncbi:nucleoside 2-deoxyribosyltransferase [Lacibacter sp. H407]|uniref:nucleoside 2-deoxyribosyltransferase n=1 Tax=Lacibacter sp. H407 TaxID=3133423 RepID=UPI0030C461B4